MKTERIRILVDDVKYLHRPLKKGGEFVLPTHFTGQLCRGRKAMRVPDPQPVQIPGTEDESGLPDDLPGRAAFLEAGLTTLDAIRGINELTSVPGIGSATAGKVVSYLTHQTEGDPHV